MKATFVKTHLHTIFNVSKIITVHYHEFDKNFVFEGERHDFWEMVYVDKGSVLITREEERLILSHGEILFHKPDEFHSIRAHCSSPDFFVITFVCTSKAMMYFENFHAVLNKTLASFIAAIIKEAKNAYVLPKNNLYLKKLIKKEGAPIGSDQLIKTYLEQLLILLVRDMTKTETSHVFPDKESMENHLITSIKSFITEGINRPFAISDLCAATGYGKSYLSRIFKEQTGNTISRYASEKKIKEAKRLIRENELNFSQISDRLSYDNPQYFSRVFRRITGMTPTEFKTSLDIPR